jgi:hypothetical protein
MILTLCASKLSSNSYEFHKIKLQKLPLLPFYYLWLSKLKLLCSDVSFNKIQYKNLWLLFSYKTLTKTLNPRFKCQLNKLF